MIMKLSMIILSLLVTILLLCGAPQISLAEGKVEITVVPDSTAPVRESSHPSCYRNSVMAFSEFLHSHPCNNVAGTEVIITFTTGTYIVNSSNSKLQLDYTETGRMTFVGEGHVVFNCITRFNFKFSEIEFLQIKNIYFNQCSGKNKPSTLILEALNSTAIISVVNISIINSIGEGIVVNFRKSNRMCNCKESSQFIDAYSFNLINSSIKTNHSGVSVGWKKECINQYFNVSNVKFLSNDSCLEMIGSGKTCTTLNVSLSGSHCNSSILSISSLAKKTPMSHFFLSNLNIKKSSSKAIVYSDHPVVIIKNKFLLHNNNGTSLLAKSSKIHFCAAIVNISFNRAKEGSTVLNDCSSTIEFSKKSTISFQNNTGQQCGGIAIKSESKVEFSENVTISFINNRGELGGAISLYSKSSLVIMPTSYLNFSRNQALKGGAIFIDDATYDRKHKQAIIIQNNSSFEQCKIRFYDNKALLGGSDIYGGWVDWSTGDNDQLTYDSIFSEIISASREESLGIASDPLRVCLCWNGVPECNITVWNKPRALYPGQILTGIQAVAVGQRYGTVVSPITIKKESGGPYEIFIVQKKCTDLTYNITSQKKEEKLLIEVLTSNEFGLNSPNKRAIREQFTTETLNNYPKELGNLFKQLSITVSLKECPKVFTLDKNMSICVCPKNLESLGLSCGKNDYTIIRNVDQWVGTAYNQVIAHKFCPYNYCKRTEESLSLYLASSSEICAHNRQGILCGACQTKLSRVLGTSKCQKCSNLYLLAAIPIFLLSGLLLVIILMLLNITISSGMLSGLIFYANVLQAQRESFFLLQGSFPSVFISWLNLDQGIEKCLYDGLDSYVEAWLQFLFPAYIWLIAGTIIVCSHYSTRISKMCGKNAVPVLATLFLLSYTKLLRLEITVVSFTSISFPDDYPDKTVWLYDGNIEYLKGKHIPLFIVTVLLLILLSVPYTLSLVAIQWILKISHYRPFFWVQKLKPFFDAYTGPYKASHRYWIGLLLLTRIFLLISFSLNHSNNPSINICIIGVISTVLLLWLFLSGGVFESKLNNYLQASFLCNLIITSLGTQFMRFNKYNSPVIVIYISTSVTFVMFVGLIFYLAHKQLLRTKAGEKMKQLLKSIKFYSKKDATIEMKDVSLKSSSKDVSQNEVGCTIIELSQPLLQEEA